MSSMQTMAKVLLLFYECMTDARVGSCFSRKEMSIFVIINYISAAICNYEIENS